MSVRETVVDALVRTLDVENRRLEVPHVPVYNVPGIWPEALTGSSERVVVDEPPASPPATVEPKLDTTRPTWDEAVEHYKAHYQHKGSYKQECVWLDELRPFLSGAYLDQIYDAILEPFVKAQLEKEIRHHANNAVLRVGVKSKTINLKLGLVRHILMEAWRKWRRPDGKTWLQTPAHITMQAGGDERLPRPLTWEEQNEHLHELPLHLHRMALFDLNCGVREDVVCSLQWVWEKRIEDLGITVFKVPPEHVKGRRGKKSARILVCNSVAQRIVDECRGEHETHVFTYARRDGARHPLTVMNNSAWQAWRERSGLGDLHVHDLRHTVGMRLREAGVPQETISSVLWHTTATMTQWYSQSTLREVHDALEKITTPAHVVNRTLSSLMAA